MKYLILLSLSLTTNALADYMSKAEMFDCDSKRVVYTKKAKCDGAHGDCVEL